MVYDDEPRTRSKLVNDLSEDNGSDDSESDAGEKRNRKGGEQKKKKLGGKNPDSVERRIPPPRAAAVRTPPRANTSNRTSSTSIPTSPVAARSFQADVSTAPPVPPDTESAAPVVGTSTLPDIGKKAVQRKVPLPSAHSSRIRRKVGTVPCNCGCGKEGDAAAMRQCQHCMEEYCLQGCYGRWTPRCRMKQTPTKGKKGN